MNVKAVVEAKENLPATAHSHGSVGIIPARLTAEVVDQNAKNEGCLRLHHFTCLFHLPGIMREGLTKGEVPISPEQVLNAPNLTSNPNHRALHWGSSCPVDKMRIRITVEIPIGDTRLEPWKTTVKKHRVAKWWTRRLDPYGQGKFWFAYFGMIPPSWFVAVEIRQGEVYQPIDDLSGLVSKVAKEKERFVRVRDPFLAPWSEVYTLDDPAQPSWLHDNRAEVAAVP